jgi:nucleoside-diphosphate-sugar epimerase
LHDTNVTGTRASIAAAYAARVRRMVHTSSIAVLDGPRGATLDETHLRDAKNTDPYYLSKIETDEVVFAALRQHTDFTACMVLPGWMHGPGDASLAQQRPIQPPVTVGAENRLEEINSLIGRGTRRGRLRPQGFCHRSGRYRRRNFTELARQSRYRPQCRRI